MRLLWWIIGILAVVLAFAGTVLPIVPTVPFLIVAAFAFNRSSPRFHHMLMTHRVFGPQIRDWQEHRAIDPRVKVIVCVSMAIGLCISWFILPHPFWAVQVAVLAAVAVFIVTRANPPTHP
ncbi:MULTISPECIES: YbaN family protein [unclassified Paracoccus (in: a-proteobacteria)]|uniref:YbaN family protein n=1 Tax=unclassified Paracoccus (in: a-proteobacteria) TaxID=2688777 RepID=UPI0015FF4711|nr:MULTISPECIES: YbaN family protein [unclassified Paracoccus (in: a-proteobacteria)]MBB1490266.1 YbaN family protein [Paracoccus sp. MC1854]MBB1498528.1 YbaN family protein [Paracoccus sp. MC1862]QQO43876.1 YbaN family protein [Paracoccus sp. MC1862]